MIDIKEYDNHQLSVNFKADNGLLEKAKQAGSINELKAIANNHFIYTDEQLSKLEQDFFDGIFDS